ncbi:MAG: hypothetical protein KDE09_08555 [Anaerolineales bacterium]|nr:hypothetical protein [Anaerolineales bacterium]MCB0017827.1 hypothetical protein [Anaerolineales bacterium]
MSADGRFAPICRRITFTPLIAHLAPDGLVSRSLHARKLAVFTGKWGDWFGTCRLLLAILLTGRLLAAYQFLSHTV